MNARALLAKMAYTLVSVCVRMLAKMAGQDSNRSIMLGLPRRLACMRTLLAKRAET